MSARVGYIYRQEDVHGVSGEGIVAEVFEASNGKVAVIWISENPCVTAYDHIKAVQNVHGHGGKSRIEWVWEAEPDPDPMEKVFAKKIEEALKEAEDIAEEPPQEKEETKKTARKKSK